MSIQSESKTSTQFKSKTLNLNLKNKNNNLLIEGENYYVLKALKTSNIKVDVIYIDPPYNTGKEFIYNDIRITKDDPYTHSKWLSFMKKRLELSKDLLKDDGVIFVSIDDNEQAYLKVLMDEIFGENNFITSFPRVTVKGGKSSSKFNTKNIDYILVYSNFLCKSFNKIKMSSDDLAFKYKDEFFETRGSYHTKQPLDSNTLGYSDSRFFSIKYKEKEYYPGSSDIKNGYCWTCSKKKIDFAIKNNFVEFKNGRVWFKKYLKSSIEKNPNGKYYIEYQEREKNYSQLEFIKNIYSNTNGTKLKNKLKIDFNYPKPISIIKTILKMISNKNSIILDFFAGSGTTGHAVMEQNQEDNGNRRFILVTNNENNICEKITYERLYRVINGKGSNNEKIDWKYSDKLTSLKDNSLRYLTIELLNKINGEYENIDNKKELYKMEFNKDISIKDFRD